MSPQLVTTGLFAGHQLLHSGPRVVPEGHPANRLPLWSVFFSPTVLPAKAQAVTPQTPSFERSICHNPSVSPGKRSLLLVTAPPSRLRRNLDTLKVQPVGLEGLIVNQR